jgi:hypothetical protein
MNLLQNSAEIRQLGFILQMLNFIILNDSSSLVIDFNVQKASNLSHRLISDQRT